MRLTPLDIQQKQFERRVRGFDQHQVKQFLELCADELEALVQENIELKADVRDRDGQIAQTREREKALQEALVSAQRLAQEMKEQARKDADIIVAEAELQGERLIHDVHQRRTGLIEELGELKRLKITFEAELKAVVEGHLKLLETFAESDRLQSSEERVALLRKRDA